MYFAQQQNPPPPPTVAAIVVEPPQATPPLDASAAGSSASSSSSASSFELDASFQRILHQHKHNKQRNERATAAAMSAGASAPPLADETIIDLCSSPPLSSSNASPAVADQTANNEIVCLLNATRSPRTTTPARRQLLLANTPNRAAGDCLSLGGIAALEKSLADVSFSADNWLGVSDESFLEQERLCQLESPLHAADDVAAADETMLFDVEAPTALWDDTIDATACSSADNSNIACNRSQQRRQFGHLSRPFAGVRSRVSTIPEESTINSSGSTMSSRPSGESNAAIATLLQSPNDEDISEISGPKPAASKGVRSTNKSISMRPSDVFRKQRPARTFYPMPDENMAESPQNEQPAQQQQHPFGANRILKDHNGISASADVLFKRQKTQPSIVEKAAPKESLYAASASPKLSSREARRQSRDSSPSLISFDDTLPSLAEADPSIGDSPIHSDLDEENNSLDGSGCLGHALPNFNDTIEAMDYYMEMGRRQKSAAASADVTEPPVVSPKRSTPTFSPKSTGQRTPDPIRRALLVRNLMRNSGASPQCVARQADVLESLE